MRVALALTIATSLLSAQQASWPPWLESADAITEYIRAAPIEKMEDIPVGVTRPRRAILARGGPVHSVVVKDLKPGRKSGYWESYQSEIAAYELDRLLQLDMVPPTVEKRVNGTRMSAQMFVDSCVWLKELNGQRAPNLAEWNRQVHRQRVFDNLIANIDRNAGNLLVYRSPDGGSWHLILVDHSRAFTSSNKVLFEMTRIDRPLYEKLKSLDAATLESRIGPLLVEKVARILQRRDAIVAHFDQLARVKGEASVFIP